MNEVGYVYAILGFIFLAISMATCLVGGCGRAFKNMPWSFASTGMFMLIGGLSCVFIA